MPTFTTTTKHALRRLTGANVGSDIDAGFSALADDLDAIIARADQGLDSARPTSTPGTPGKFGGWYWATDTKVLTFDYGTGWIIVYGCEPWHTLSLAANWSAEVTAPGAVAGYYRQNEEVRLRGMLIRDTGSTTTLFTLPAGYRPSSALTFVVPATRAANDLIWVKVAISTAGVVSAPRTDVLPPSVVLDGISFRAEQ